MLLNKFQTNFRRASIVDAVYLIFLSVIAVSFVAFSFESGALIFNSLDRCFQVWFLSGAAIFLIWSWLISCDADPSRALVHARISLSPFLILLILIPFDFFYPLPQGTHSEWALGIVCFGIWGLHRTLAEIKIEKFTPVHFNKFAIFFLVCYIVCFGGISVLRHLNYQNASSFDVALYNQIQWNNLHGRFFESSISGSNFVTHNSPFLVLLTPFYAIYPHPAMLIFLKTIFIAAGAVPFYWIAREVLDWRSSAAMTVGYLFYPYIIGQNFNAPHEACFLPPFLLFTYYFFIKDRFRAFIISLLFTLSIKEHLALVAVVFGLYGVYLRKNRRWIFTPIVIGVIWALLSVCIIYTAQKFYHVDKSPAWLIENIKGRFLVDGLSPWEGIKNGLATSNLASINSASFAYSLISPVGIVIPFLAPVVLLGMPELAINLVASIPLTYPIWHYNIIVSIFLLISSVQVIGKFSEKRFVSRMGLSKELFQQTMSFFILLCILSHFFLWWADAQVHPRGQYKRTMDLAVSLIPKEATVSAPKHLVAYVSSRRDYFLLEDDRKGTYVLLDKDETLPADFLMTGHDWRYSEIFNTSGIRLYRKN